MKRRKIFTRIIASALAMSMTFTGIGDIANWGTYGIGSNEVKAATTYSLSGPRVDDQGDVIYDCVYFGKYWQIDTNGDGKADKQDNKTPIKWRVLSVNGDEALLMADRILDVQQYNDRNSDVTWEKCLMRSWLNGYGTASNLAGNDYSSNSFLSNAFSSNEQSGIIAKIISNKDNQICGTGGGNDTKDKLFLLSLEDIVNSAYGFSNFDFDKGNRSTIGKVKHIHNNQDEYDSIYDFSKLHLTTEFVGYLDGYYTQWMRYDTVTGEGICSDIGTGYWFLRSPGDESYTVANVSDDGFVNYEGYGVCADDIGVVPALYLDLSFANLYRYAGTVCGIESDDCFTDTDITINGAGRAYVHYLLKDTEGNVLKKTTVQYSYEGSDETQVAISDENGYIYLYTPEYENKTKKVKEEKCVINLTALGGIKLANEKVTISCKVLPVSYTSELEGTISGTLGLDAGGIGASAELGPLSVGAYAGVGADFVKSSTLTGSVSVDGETEKKEMELSTTYNNKVTGKGEGKVGASWGNKDGVSAKERAEKGKFDVTALNLGAKASVATSDSVGITIEDCDDIKLEDCIKLWKFYMDILVNSAPKNEMLISLYEAIVDSYYDKQTHGVDTVVSGDLSEISFKVANANFTTAGIGRTAKYSYKATTKEKEKKYVSNIVSEGKKSLLEFNVGEKYPRDVEAKIKLFDMRENAKNNVTLSAKKDLADSDNNSLNLKYAVTEDKGCSLYSHTITKYEEHTAKGNAIDLLTDRNKDIDKLYTGKMSLLTTKSFSKAAEEFYENDIQTEYEKLIEDKSSFDFPVSLSVDLGVGGKIGGSVSGSKAYSYTTGLERVYDVDVQKFGTKCVIGSTSNPSKMINTNKNLFEEVLKSAKAQLEEEIFNLLQNAVASVKQGVVNGAAAIKKNMNATKNRVIRIVTTIDGIIPFASDKVSAYSSDKIGEDDVTISLSKGQSAIIGKPYVVTVSEDETEIQDFSDEPLEFSIAYDDQTLNEAGVSLEQAKDICMYLYNPDLDVYEHVEAVNDTEEQVVEATITKSGQYLLGIDYAQPIVIGFTVSDSYETPTINVYLDDISGISSVCMSIDGKEVIDDTNKDAYFNKNVITYKVLGANKLSVGTHTVEVSATDKTGNEMSEPEIFMFDVISSSNSGATEEEIQTPNVSEPNVLKPVISKVKKAKKSCKITWKKNSDVSGYELQYSLKKTFKLSKTKKYAVTKNSATIKKLKSGKKYYIRMRAYKLVDGKKYYSDWSKVKNVKVK